jgi:predicted transcriptional regulator of viral defense system
MRTQSSGRSVDRIISAIAAKQHGVVARSQLLAAGITARQIVLRLGSGRLHQIHRGVYLVGHAAGPPLASEQAALLACGGGAVLSRGSAANLWSLFPYPASAPPWVTVPPERRLEGVEAEYRRLASTAELWWIEYAIGSECSTR